MVPGYSIEAARGCDPQCIIIGAGVAGSALACGLARSGRRVLLLERSLEIPDRIVGELLQPRGVLALEELGLQKCLNGIEARVCRGYTIFRKGTAVNIPYPEQRQLVEDLEEPETLPERNKGVQEGRSFHHGAFVASLRKAAMAEPAVTCLEAAVIDVIRCADSGRILGVRAIPSARSLDLSEHSAASDVLHLLAPLVICTDGCFSKFRRIILPDVYQPSVRSHFVALLLRDAHLPDPGHGHVFLPEAADSNANVEGQVGPVLVYQLDAHETRMLIDVPGEKAPRLSDADFQARLKKTISPLLPADLLTAFQDALTASYDGQGSSRLRSMPNSWLPPQPQHSLPAVEGCLILGDALSMRHPLTGGGMTVALTDVSLLVRALGGGKGFAGIPGCSATDIVDLEDWSAVTGVLRTWHHARKPLASTVNVLAQALYRLFGATDVNLEVLKEGCFAYFEQGGECIKGPISLLSALAPSRLNLFYHFFSVALLSIGLLFRTPRKSSPGASMRQWPRLTKQSLSVVCTALTGHCFSKQVLTYEQFATACAVFLPVLWREW